MATYNLATATDDSIGKTWPQTDGWNFEYPFIFELEDYFLREPPELLHDAFFKIKNSAKPTDFISSGMLMFHGFVMSLKAYDIISQFQIVRHRIYPFTIIHRHKRFPNYLWFHFCEDHCTIIDFPRTKFVAKSIPFTHIPNWDFKPEVLQIETYDSWLIETMKYAGGKEIVVEGELYLTGKAKELDWYYFYGIHQPNRISERLAAALAEEKVTGLDISQAGNVIKSKDSFPRFE